MKRCILSDSCVLGITAVIASVILAVFQPRGQVRAAEPREKAAKRVGDVQPMFNRADRQQHGKKDDKRRPTTTIWESILYESLWLHCQDKHQEVFDLVENATRSRDPGAEVHRCLAMMRRSFIDLTKTPEPIHHYSEKAKAYIDGLDRRKDKAIPDLVILSVLIPREQSLDWVTEPLLDKIIESGSPWRDWAYWEKARVVGLKASDSTHPWGLATYECHGREYTACSTEIPKEAIAGRAVIKFLQDNPRTYMRDVFLADFIRWRLLQARRAAYCLRREQEVMGYPLSDEQVNALRVAEETFISSWQRKPELKLQILEDKLDRHLWGDFYCDDVKGLLVEYLNAVMEAKGKGILPTETHKPFITPPDPEKHVETK